MYRCGCANEIHESSGVLQSVSKCAKHLRAMRDPSALGREYYEELGTIADKKLKELPHVAQLVDALGELPRARKATPTPWALEIGCGTSPYADAIKKNGYVYWGIDSSKWVSGWMLETYKVHVHTGDFETAKFSHRSYDLILCAHAFEHMLLAPSAIHKAASLLVPGGQLWVIVPDDSDPLNADHLWFFTEATLRATIERAGLVVDRLVSRKHIERENFIYARASKC